MDCDQIPQHLLLDGSSGSYASTPDSAALSLRGTNSTLRLTNHTGTNVRTPDSAALSITGDIDIRVKAAFDRWAAPTVGTTNYIISKYLIGGNQRSWLFSINDLGRITFWNSANGVALIGRTSTTSVPFAPGQAGWIRVTLNVDNGAGDNDAKFYTSDDGIIWVQLGTTVTTAGVTSIFDSTAAVQIDAFESGGNINEQITPGSIYYAEIRNGIAGTIVANPDFTIAPWVIGDIASAARADTSGNIWTLNGNAEIVAQAERRSLRLSGASGMYASAPDSAALSLQGTAQGLAFNGDSAGTISTPDSIGLSVTGDLDVQFRLQPDVWGLPTQINLGGKYGAAGQRSWRIQIGGNSRPSLEISSDGTAVTFVPANATPSFTAGQAGWIRVTWRASDGRVQFFTAPDAATPVWTQLGTDQTAAIGSIFNSTTAVAILGSANLSPSTIRLLAFRMYAGLTETDNRANLILTASPWLIGDQSGIARSDGINTWTIGGTAEIVATAERRALRLNGTTGVWASAPDSAALSITGDIDLRVKLALGDWTPSSTNDPIGKWASGQRSYFLTVTSAGNLQMNWSNDGTSQITRTSTVALGLTDGSVKWIRATLDVDNGAAGHDVKFYTSNDGVIWSQLGTTVTTAGVTSIFDGTAVLGIGAIDGGTTHLTTGNIFYVEVRNGIDGTIVANPNFTARPWDVGETGGATGVDAAGNTWTLNGAGAAIQRAFDSILDLRVKVALDDWTPTSDNTLISKWNDGSGRDYILWINTAGAPTLVIEGADTIRRDQTSTASVSVSDGAVKWIRATAEPSVPRVRFYTSDNGVTWVQLGTDRTPATTWTWADTTVAELIGAYNGGSAARLTGNVFYAEARNGIDGTMVANPDFQKRPWDEGETNGVTGVDAAGNTWTLNGTGAVIQRAFASDLDIRVKFSSDLWTVGTSLISKWPGSGNRAWTFIMSGTTNRPQFAISGNGTALIFNNVSTADSIWSAGAVIWWRVTIDIDNGSGGSTLTMYDSLDGVIWRQFYTTTSTTGLRSVFDSSVQLMVGAQEPGTNALFTGKFYYTEIRNGIDGIVVGAFNPSGLPWEPEDTAPTAYPGATNEIWTLNGNAVIGGDPTCNYPGGLCGPTYAFSMYAGGSPCIEMASNPDLSVGIKSNVEEFCVLEYICSL